ncbi:MAG: hypothetical protein ACRETH_08410, partial [Steroidobacteraceae bacterium]
FYHVCEYLSAAAKALSPHEAGQKAWMEAQKEALKTGALARVLQALAPHLEAAGIQDDEAPVRRCHRSCPWLWCSFSGAEPLAQRAIHSAVAIERLCGGHRRGSPVGVGL